MIQRIIGSAICGPPHEDRFYWLLSPARHHDVIEMMVECGEPTPITGLQGFVLDDGTFIDRIEARKLAIINGQCREPRHYRDLFSEDMW